MQIFVKNVDGSTQVLNINVDATVSDLKNTLTEEFSLSHNGRLLNDLDDSTLSSLGITELSTISTLVPLLGGGKKKKKKKHTTPKRKKHVKKKVKLAALKCYKVDSNGDVNRLRETCIFCRDGVFMANHYDRKSCGRCGHTVKLKEEVC